MKDAVSISRAKLLHPKVRDEVITTIGEIEATWEQSAAIRIVQGLRTIEQQNALYAQGRTMPGMKVTNAKGGKSYHNYGIAIDFALIFDKDGNGSYETLSWDVKNPKWMEVVKAFELKEWFWGGKFSSIKDYPHLQKTFGFAVSSLLSKYNAKDFISNTRYLNI